MYHFKKTNELDFRTYSLLSWFNAKTGQIFVSNDFLCERLHVSKRTLQRSLERLKESNKIQIFNGGSFRRQIVVIPDFKEKQIIDIPNYNWLE